MLKKFSENGANVIACARKQTDQFEKEICDIKKKNHNQITPIYFDLLKEEEIEQGVKKINSLFNNIDIIVNNAGVNQASLFQMTSIKNVKEIFDFQRKFQIFSLKK